MRIAFYAPFKPLDHPNPSGDLVIARSIYDFLEQRGHSLRVPSGLRCRWIFWKPHRLLQALFEIRRSMRILRTTPADLWLTYHSYYKAPDIVGPRVCRQLNIPYVIIQGSYATKFRRRLQTWPGFQLNRQALLTADKHITTRQRDHMNLKRLISPEKLVSIKPGIDPDDFVFNPAAREAMHSRWQVRGRPVILTAAMFRPDVKSEGIAWVIECCRRLHSRGHRFLLAIAGDGREKNRLQQLAAGLPSDTVVFTGRLPREQMDRFYSAGDLFVFPGFRESLGMVFLEAQCSGLPVVACDNGGIPEVVVNGQTGLLSAVHDEATFDANVQQLLTNKVKRRAMGSNAAQHVHSHHDIKNNYRQLEKILHTVQSSYQNRVSQ